jgi:hypothetical protein
VSHPSLPLHHHQGNSIQFNSIFLYCHS